MTSSSARRQAELNELVARLRASLTAAQATISEQEHTIQQQRSEIMHLRAHQASRRNRRLRQQALERQRG